MKTCTKCMTAKELSAFRLRPERNAYTASCKECDSASSAHRQRIRRPSLTAADKQRQNADRRTRKARDPLSKRKSREWYLKHKYGMTRAEQDAFLSAQGGKCVICRTELQPDTQFGLTVDHCHATGRVRGLLCNSCNIGLGKFKDNPAFLERALVYLTMHEPQRYPDLVLASSSHETALLARAGITDATLNGRRLREQNVLSSLNQ